MVEHDAAIAPRHAGHVVGIELVCFSQSLRPGFAHRRPPDGAFLHVLRQHGGIGLFRRGEIVGHEKFPPVGHNRDVSRRFQQFIGGFGGCGRGPVLNTHGRARPRDLRRQDQSFALGEQERRKIECRIHDGAVAFRFRQKLTVAPGHGRLERDQSRRFPDGFGAHELDGALFPAAASLHVQQFLQFGGFALARPGCGIGGKVHLKGLFRVVFSVRGVMRHKFFCSLVGLVGGSRSVDNFRRHGRGIDDFALFSGAAAQTGTEQKRQNQRGQFLRSGLFGHVNLKTLTKDSHHARGMAHDHDAGNQQCQKAASAEDDAGCGQIGGGKAVLKAVPKAFLITFHVEGRLMQIGQRLFGNEEGGSFHERPSSLEVLASVSTRLTASTRSTACG